MSFMSKLFGKKNNKYTLDNNIESMGGSFYDISDWNGDIYESDIARAAIWANAKNAGKLNPKHIRKSADKYDLFPIPKIKRLLTRPNPYMSMSVFINKMIVQCQKKNNAFAIVKFGNDGWPDGIYPVTYNTVEVVEKSGIYYIKFILYDGSEMIAPYSEIIHIRLHIDEKEIFGSSNQKAMSPLMKVINETDKSIVTAIKRSAFIRWVLKFSSVLDPEDKKKAIDEFVNNYLSIENSGGAAGVDHRYDAVQVKPDNYVPNASLMDRAKERIHSYFGISEAIIQSTFKEYEWNAYYENTIEPFAIQLSEEFTEKIFTQHERECGNMIIFESNRLQYASNNTKISVARFLADIGAAELDQILEIFNLAPIGGEDGKRRVQTLNMINAEKADQYQLGEENESEEIKDE